MNHRRILQGAPQNHRYGGVAARAALRWFNPITSAKNVWLVWLYQYNSGYNTNNTNNSGYIWLYDGIITYYIYIYVYIYIWLVVYLPLWKMMEWKSMGRMTSLYEMENNPVMFETTRDCIQCIRWCSHCIPQLKTQLWLHELRYSRSNYRLTCPMNKNRHEPFVFHWSP